MIPGKSEPRRRDISDFLLNLKQEDPTFKENDLLSYTEKVIKSLYNILKNNELHKNIIKCQNKVIEKMLKNKQKYRIVKDIDRMSIQYVGLYEGIEEDNKKYIKVNLSIYFYDNTKNNTSKDMQMTDKYWNDIWTVTYQRIDSKDRKNSNCENCGATMNYNRINKLFKCDYCGNIKIYTEEDLNWEIVDIEVQ